MRNLKSKPRKLISCLRAMAIALLMTSAISIYAQTNDTISTQEPKKNEDTLYAPFSSSWEKQPEYPGGFDALKKFIESEMKYPQIAKENGIQGRVITNFVIEKDGTLTDPQIVRGVDPLLDQEALRILNAMTATWSPGEQTGKIVRVRFTLPIVFRLPKAETAEISSDDVKTTFRLEKQPEFPGGTQALMKYLEENLRYPPIHIESSIGGRVITNFIVHKDGSISDINIVKGFDTSINAEAVRVISNMPNWEPGIQKGEVVNVRYRLPIMFNLKSDEEPTKAEDEVFEVVEQQPEFPGGMEAMMKFLAENIKYPATTRNIGQGRMITNFVINKDGSITDIQVIEGIDPLLDTAAIKAIGEMPNWRPGMQRGKAVRVRYTLPIMFKSEDDKEYFSRQKM